MVVAGSVLLIVFLAVASFAVVIVLSALLALRTAHPLIMVWVFAFAFNGVLASCGAVVVWLYWHMVGPAALLAALAGLSFYWAWQEWKRKPPRRKEPRMLAVVREIGGRLGIVPT